MTEQEYRQQLAAAGFPEPVLVERDSSYRLGTHQHPFDAFALIIDGELTIDVDGTETTYRAGESFRLKKDVPHSEFAGAGGVRYLSGRRQGAAS